MAGTSCRSSGKSIPEGHPYPNLNRKIYIVQKNVTRNGTLKSSTQPWKTGLPSDFTPRGTTLKSRAGIWLRGLTGRGAGHYQRHPDPAQERLCFRLLGECLDNGSVSAAMLSCAVRWALPSSVA